MEPSHEYKNVPVHDDVHHDDDSATEVESLVGSEKQWAADTYQTSKRRSKRTTCLGLLKASRWLVIIALQLAIVGMMAKERGYLKQFGLAQTTRSSSAKEIGGDITGWGPHSKPHIYNIQTVDPDPY
jgi:hypothetical protein